MDRVHIVKIKLGEKAKKLCYKDEVLVSISSQGRLDYYEILDSVKNQYGADNVVSLEVIHTIFPDFEFLQSLSPSTLVAVRKLHKVLKHSTYHYDNESGREIFEVNDIFDREGEGRKIVRIYSWSDSCFYMDTGLFEPGDIITNLYDICFLDRPTEKEIKNFKNRRNKNIKIADIKRRADDTDDIETINLVWDIINKKEEGN